MFSFNDSNADSFGFFSQTISIHIHRIPMYVRDIFLLLAMYNNVHEIGHKHIHHTEEKKMQPTQRICVFQILLGNI